MLAFTRSIVGSPALALALLSGLAMATARGPAALARGGFDAHLAKPVDPDKLLLEVTRLTGRYRI